jgi:cytochrome c553
MKAQLLTVALVVGCQPATAVDKPPPVPSPRIPPVDDIREPTDELMVRFHMYRSYDLLRAIERLLVRNNLEDARALATSIAEAQAPGALELWVSQTAAVRTRAAELANAPGIDEACRRVARLAGACARCHVNAGAMPMFANPPAAPPDRDDVAARMARHRWAADRLWEGMVGNADEPWRAGIDVLAQTPLHFSPLDGGRAALAKRLQQLADQARQRELVDAVSERAQVYGEILVTCAACHRGGGTTPVL